VEFNQEAIAYPIQSDFQADFRRLVEHRRASSIKRSLSPAR
jgi:hypothetical protein